MFSSIRQALVVVVVVVVVVAAVEVGVIMMVLNLLIESNCLSRSTH